ncbi:hypothetical protein QBC32DRAFT_316591 [Pseudoneurospora amorphoporcata]|uniref:Uncharacterized protein n=1 Tax=Pseudoneurospora amorphoporcata TaxID=241081 RepID=A0AAN6NPI0_9PEZI|nr:hypothetical protein QBC32DRAFT_316591 [Pseudoneurospora amorphoporcata]
MENYSKNHASADFEVRGLEITAPPASPTRSPSHQAPTWQHKSTPAAQDPAVALGDDGHDLPDYEHYEALDTIAASEKASGPGIDSAAAGASAEHKSENDDLVQLQQEFKYHEGALEQKQAAKMHSRKTLVTSARRRRRRRRRPSPLSSAFSGNSNVDHSPPVQKAQLERRKNAYPSPSPWLSPEAEKEYDADAESDADDEDDKDKRPGGFRDHSSFCSRSYNGVRDKLICEIKAHRQANKAMRNRLRRIEGCKKYERVRLLSLAKELVAVREETYDLKYQLQLANMEVDESELNETC